MLLTRLITILFITAVAVTAAPAEKSVLNLEDGFTDTYTGTWSEILFDISGSMTIENAMKSANWRSHDKDVVSLSFLKYPVWIRFTFRDSRNTLSPLLLHLQNPLLNSIDLYLIKAGRITGHVHTGDAEPYGSRPVESNDFIFHLEQEKQPVTCVLRIESTSAMKIPLEIMTFPAYIRQSNGELMILWALYGILIMLVLHNLFLFLSERDRVYGLLASFLIFWLMYELAHLGYGYQYLWSDSIWFQEHAVPFSISGALTFIGLYFTAHLRTKESFPVFHKLIRALVIIPGAVMLPVSIIAPYQVAIKIVLVLGLIASPLLMLLPVAGAFRRNRQAYFILAGFTAQLIGQMMSNLLAWGIIPFNLFTSHTVHVSGTLLMILVSLGLMDKLNIMRKSLEVSELNMKEKNLELEATNEEMHATLEELEAANEEFEAQNEELIASQILLEQNEKQIRIIVENLPLPLIVENDGTISYINGAFRRAYFNDIDSVTDSDKLIKKLLPDGEVRRKAMEEILLQSADLNDGEMIYLGHFRLSTGYGNTRETEIYITKALPLRLFILIDITEQMRTRDLILQTEKMMTIGGLSAGMAHEINNPLSIIVQGVQSIRRRLDPAREENNEAAAELGVDLKSAHEYFKSRHIDQYMDGIEEAGHRAAAIVVNMLNFSRKSSIEKKEYNIHSIIDETLDLASKDYNLKKGYDFRKIQIIRKFDASLPRVNCVLNEIQQVILNIIKNASQAMSTCKDEDSRPQLTIKTAMDNAMIAISIRDNGPGIPAEYINSIFDPFFTTKIPGSGTGLGLYVSRYIINDRHSGQISARNLPDGGTEFLILLPVVQSEII